MSLLIIEISKSMVYLVFLVHMRRKLFLNSLRSFLGKGRINNKSKFVLLTVEKWMVTTPDVTELLPFAPVSKEIDSSL